MNQTNAITYKLVTAIPGTIEDMTLYVSMDYGTAVHKCCCGCGNEVVTPLSPTDWRLIYDGVSMSLYPSIGNWGFDCRSHYWIDRNNVVWADPWSDDVVAAGRASDHQAKSAYHCELPPQAVSFAQPSSAQKGSPLHFLARLKEWWKSR